ncbi:dentin sialophosphoprotein isoform X2 [Nymphalis io]|uniref:dentin sialophosphoprotein isoform X2 n=1 Tax=Inachis io TaxID=171585 RepID=UPI00216A613C|nr:dentin sialophosphoprotein isoform X2 [Nymphalis io]
MEVDGGVKAPVTRLRRRMSIEQSEESKSPALSTPTKKRGRRAAKPDLDFIDENNPDNNTTKTTTKKAPVKEIIDSIEEKPTTPSRRSTRIKSNTSIVSDITSGIDSPRAKRATRRTSQIGSDTEAPPTPVRQTRRTRKDSISSIEKVEIQPSTKPTIQITEMILEEPESNSSKSTSNTDLNEKNTSTGNLRKSPRLKEKIKQNTSINEEKITQDGNDEPTDQLKLNSSLNKSLEASNPKENENKDEETADIKVPQKNRHSLLTSNLLKNLSTEEKTNNLHLNKSTSALEIKHNSKKRNRTKSWTTETVSNENNFYSDNEGLRKKNNDDIEIPFIKINKLNSGDGINTSIHKDKVNKSKSKENSNSFVEGDINMDTSMTNVGNKSMDKKSDKNCGTLIFNQSNNEKNNLNVTNKLFETEPSCDIQTVVYIDEDSDTNSGKVGIQNRHDHEDQCVPVIQHSEQLEKDISQFSVMSQKNDSIKTNLSENDNIMNDSCEPMDIDETIPESSLIPEIKTDNIFSSSPCVLLDKSETKEKQLNKSKRKSSISMNLNKSENENKSTLILSQLKDSSSGDINNVTKSPQIKQSIVSKTTDDLNATQENDINKKNLSLNYVTTSTPLQQKNLQKLDNINTSIIKSNNDTNNIKNKIKKSSKNNKTSDVDNESSSAEETSQKNINEISKNKSNLNNSLNKTKTNEDDQISKNEKEKNTSNDSNDSKGNNESLNNKSKKPASNSANSSKKSVNKSFTSTDSDEEMASNEESQESVNLIDDEAEDAGESYESGDSQDETERRYLRENEILEKGETLTSDDDLSDDSDYEKDSFVVSSAEEDNELLNGTEDDLSMSDNELKMTTKSKKKYDERKKKEQKNASREMYESRHQLNISNKSSNSKIGNSKRRKQQQISSSESEDENEMNSKKKNHRMRLDSSHEVSLQEDENEKNISDKKRKRLSESFDENVINEKEITICNESLKEIDPLSTQVKEEQKTPQKADSSIAFITENDPNMESELTKTQTEIVDPLEDSMAEEDSLSSDNENIMQNYDSILEGLNKTSKIKSKKCDISLNVNKKKEQKKNTAIIDELNLTQVKSAKKNKNNKHKKEINNTSTDNKMAKPDIDRNSSPDSIDLHLLISEDSNSSDNIQNNKNTSNTEDFIPLKRSEGKTNIRENTDNMNENNESFFIDTEGTTTQCNNSLNKSSSKKNKKKISLVNNDNLDLDYDEIIDKKDVSMATNKTETNENSDSDGPMDVPFKKEKRNSKIQENIDEVGKAETDFAKDPCNTSVTKTPNSDKKKKKKMTESLNIKPTENESNLNISLSKTKKKKSTDVIIEDSSEKDKPEQVFDESMTKTPGSKKKKHTSQSIIQEQDEEGVPMDKSFGTPSSISKKKKQLLFSPENNQTEQKGDLSLDESKLKTPGSNKKNKLSIKSQEIEQTGDLPESSLNTSKIKTPGSQKKKKVSEHEKEGLNISTPDSTESKETNSNTSTGESKTLTTEVELNHNKNTKRRKRKSSNTPPEETVLEDEVNTPKQLNQSLVCTQKKKRKVSQNEKTITKVKANKRKERDDDEENKISKVAKENSFDTVHVPRLPTSILKQLDDKPKQILTTKKPKLVSTTQFTVVEAKRRRNKPSNYLEESIYINDDEPENKKQKKVLQKPKVLPFVPTVLTSGSGYTTNFKVNVIPTEMKFVAQSNTISNFKEDFLFNKNIRRHGTYELYKRKRNIKISKF